MKPYQRSMVHPETLAGVIRPRTEKCVSRIPIWLARRRNKIALAAQQGLRQAWRQQVAGAVALATAPIEPGQVAH